MTTPRNWREQMEELRERLGRGAERRIEQALRTARLAIPPAQDLATLTPADAAAAITAGLIRVQYRENLDQAGRAISRSALIGVSGIAAGVIDHQLTVDSPRSVQVIQNGGSRLARLEPANARAVSSIIASLRNEGAGINQIVAQLRRQVPAGRFSSSGVRAKLIARTEVRYAQNVAAVAVAEDAGITEVQLLDGQLPGSDDFCRGRNGTIVSLRSAMALLDAEHPNGTLDFIPIVR